MSSHAREPLRAWPEIVADLKARLPDLSPVERRALRGRVEAWISDIMQDAQQNAEPAIGGLTACYREAYQSLLESQRLRASELTEILALLGETDLPQSD